MVNTRDLQKLVGLKWNFIFTMEFMKYLLNKKKKKKWKILAITIDRSVYMYFSILQSANAVSNQLQNTKCATI